MTQFYAGRHRAPQLPTLRKTGLSITAAAALSLTAPALLTTGSASAAPATVSTPSAKSTTSSFSGIVSYGDRGSVVREIQRAVGASADGIFGPATLSAVKRYQASHGLTVDGVVGPRTGTDMGLGGSSSSTSNRPSSSSSNFTGLVSYGDRGSVVREIQRAVGASADGIFGPGTRSAVKRYQASHGLTVDGVVGPRTGSVMGLTGSSSTTRPSRDNNRPSLGGGTSSSSVLGTAAGLVGTPYRYGGTTPSGFDCSGFTQYVFAKHGVSLPRTAEQQRQATTRVSSPQPGDLVFFGAPAYHNGIYAGNGMMYDSGNSRVPVSKRAIWTSNVTYGRV
ncbi:peptidoglycan-binding protein [Janibacter cremeus]|uniref:Cell wall-associated NlpC family hydrolase n=1 Tax=Janibacter cremeus TaxID=1285192 RepID=A0A852VQZ3_9MICO|nr:peptidoglycan-binding protein [Janibacter cremeus]NYF98359.1 cell wall-associated NlpC family hydrolase [Janibacter cremeus]